MHNFKLYPELTNSEMDAYYFMSPHKQITENFRATCVKVHDGDTITLTVEWRDFKFPMRFLNTNAPELSEEGGFESRDWLKEKIEGEEIDIQINPKNRVDKYGRLLGEVIWRGLNLNEQSMIEGKATTFANRNADKFPNLNKELSTTKWF